MYFYSVTSFSFQTNLRGHLARKCLDKFCADHAHYVIQAVISPGNSDENSDVSDFLAGRNGKMKNWDRWISVLFQDTAIW